MLNLNIYNIVVPQHLAKCYSNFARLISNITAEYTLSQNWPRRLQDSTEPFYYFLCKSFAPNSDSPAGCADDALTVCGPWSVFYSDLTVVISLVNQTKCVHLLMDHGPMAIFMALLISPNGTDGFIFHSDKIK